MSKEVLLLILTFAIGWIGSKLWEHWKYFKKTGDFLQDIHSSSQKRKEQNDIDELKERIKKLEGKSI